MEKTANSDKGIKYDDGKLRIDLIPPEVIRALAMVFAYGADKYGRWNWEKGMRAGRLWAATLWAATQRHLWSWWNKEDMDEESGYNHLWHALVSIAMLIVLQKRGTGEDDRT